MLSSPRIFCLWLNICNHSQRVVAPSIRENRLPKRFSVALVLTGNFSKSSAPPLSEEGGNRGASIGEIILHKGG